MKTTILSLLVMTATAFAGVMAPFTQFGLDSYTLTPKPGQTKWDYSQMVSLHVTAGTEVWLTSIITNWYGTNQGLSEIFNMSAGRYGYIKDNGTMKNQLIEKSEYAANGIAVTPGDGKTTEVTFYSDANPALKQTATAYYLGYFGEDTEIFFAMSPLNPASSEITDGYQFVHDPVDGHEATDLASRQLTASGQLDMAGNVRVNFGILNDGLSGHEFTALLAAGSAPPSGQPLPEAFISAVLMLMMAGASKLVKFKR